MVVELEKEHILGFYEDIAVLDKEKDVYLVQNQFTHKIYVKKRIKTYNIHVYENLKAHPHKNIPRIYALLERDEYLIVIEEFVNGMNLEELMNEAGKLEKEVVKDYFFQILDGLDHIHQLNPPVIHRDLKLSNVMINDDGIIKIIDFNTSRLYDEKDIKDTVIMGTPGYAAPEQYGFRQSDPRSDIYALGVLLNYLLTGKHIGDELHQGEYKSIIEKCTDMSPDSRFTNIHQLRIALDKGGREVFKKEKPRKFLWPIPGFRTNRIWKKIIAIPVYLLILYFSITVEFENVNSVTLVINRIFLFIALSVLAALYSNYLNIQDLLPLCRSGRRLVRIIGCILFTPIIFVFCIFVAAIISSFFQ